MDTNQPHKILIIHPAVASTLTWPEAERDAVMWNIVQAVSAGNITPAQGAQAGAGLLEAWQGGAG